MDVTKIELNKWYSLSEIARLRPLPVNNYREALVKQIERDLDGANLLDTVRIPWKIKGKYTYRIQGKNIIKYVSMRGWEQ